MIKIDYATALSTAEAIVEEFGEEYVYPKSSERESCAYLKKGENGKFDLTGACLVGKVLAKLGVDMTKFLWVTADGEQLGYSDNTARFSTLEHERFGIEVTDKAKRFLSSAQYRQDDNDTWGEALKAGLEAAASARYNENEMLDF